MKSEIVQAVPWMFGRDSLLTKQVPRVIYKISWKMRYRKGSSRFMLIKTINLRVIMNGDGNNEKMLVKRRTVWSVIDTKNV